MACLAAVTMPPLDVPPDASPKVAQTFGAVRPPIHNPFWDVSTFVNASTGNDNNTCVDSSHPCKTHAEIVARNGVPCPIRTTSVVETILSDLPSSDPITLCDIQFTGGSFELAGTLASVSTGNLSGVVAKNRGANQALNVNLGSAAAGSVRLLVQNTTHSSWAGVKRVLSGNVVLMSQPMAPTTTTSPIPGTEVDTWTNGDIFTVWRPTKATVISSSPTLGDFITNSEFIYHMWIADASGSGLNTTLLSLGTVVGESIVDAATLSNQALFTNVVFGPNALPLVADSTANGGSIFDGGLLTSTITSHAHDCDIGNDALVDSLAVYAELAYGDIFLEGTALVGNSGLLISSDAASASYGAGTIYGLGTTNPTENGTLEYSGALGAATSFPGATLLQDGLAFAVQITNTTTGPLFVQPNVALTAANLDGVFGGLAYSADHYPRYVSSTALGTMPAPTVSVVGTGNGGTGLDAGCPDGSTYQGTGPGTPAQCVFVAGATLPDPVTAPHGGTGDTSLTAHAELIGAGTSAVAFAGPCTSPGSGTTGIATIWPNNTSDPICGTVSVPGGGTGLQTLTNGCLLVGNGGNAVNVVCPGTAGNVLTNVGGVWTSASPPSGAVSSVNGTNGLICSPTTGAASCGLSIPVTVDHGGTGATSFTNFGVLIGDNTSSINATAAGTTGQVLTAVTGGSPTFQSPAVPLPQVNYGQGGGSVLNVGSTGSATYGCASLTVPTGGSKLLIDADVTTENQSAGLENTTWGISVDNTSGSFSVSTQFSNPGVVASNTFYGSSLHYANSYVAGSHTACIQAFAFVSGITLTAGHIHVMLAQ
jgi:hypothetical protein